jgi:GT2 family glycosyltransferase
MTDIILICYNEIEYTIKTIESLKKTTTDYNLIVIDNGSTDGTNEYLSNINCKLITNKNNIGYTKAVNQGFELTTNDVVLLNNDIILTPNWLIKLKEHLKDGVGLVAPMTNYAFGIQRDDNALYNSIDNLYQYCKLIEERKPIEFPRLIFMCILINRELINKIGYLDEQFNPGNFEDDDYCLRSLKAGFKNILARNVFIHHFGSKSFGKLNNYGNILELNRKKFESKYGKTHEEIFKELI